MPTVGQAGLGFQAISALTNAYAQWEAGQARKDLAEYNAKVADLQAEDALRRGAARESAHRMAVRKLIGAQRAGFAASHVAVGSGTAAAVQADSAILGEIDAQQIKNNAFAEAWGYRLNAANARVTGTLEAAQGRIAAIGSLIQGGAQTAQLYQRQKG